MSNTLNLIDEFSNDLKEKIVEKFNNSNFELAIEDVEIEDLEISLRLKVRGLDFEAPVRLKRKK